LKHGNHEAGFPCVRQRMNHIATVGTSPIVRWSLPCRPTGLKPMCNSTLGQPSRRVALTLSNPGAAASCRRAVKFERNRIGRYLQAPDHEGTSAASRRCNTPLSVVMAPRGENRFDGTPRQCKMTRTMSHVASAAMQRRPGDDADVIVAGAGPAGAAFATRRGGRLRRAARRPCALSARQGVRRFRRTRRARRSGVARRHERAAFHEHERDGGSGPTHRRRAGHDGRVSARRRRAGGRSRRWARGSVRTWFDPLALARDVHDGRPTALVTPLLR
jgi:hypothetical protein